MLFIYPDNEHAAAFFNKPEKLISAILKVTGDAQKPSEVLSINCPVTHRKYERMKEVGSTKINTQKILNTAAACIPETKFSEFTMNMEEKVKHLGLAETTVKVTEMEYPEKNQFLILMVISDETQRVLF
jgi:hypothetical protein